MRIPIRRTEREAGIRGAAAGAVASGVWRTNDPYKQIIIIIIIRRRRRMIIR